MLVTGSEKGFILSMDLSNQVDLDYFPVRLVLDAKWIMDDETEKEALIREIQEELSLTIEVGEKFIIVDHDYPDFSISMHTYHCVSETRDIILTEHIDYKWLAISDLKVLDWAAADIPIVNKLRGQ